MTNYFYFLLLPPKESSKEKSPLPNRFLIFMSCWISCRSTIAALSIGNRLFLDAVLLRLTSHTSTPQNLRKRFEGGLVLRVSPFRHCERSNQICYEKYFCLWGRRDCYKLPRITKPTPISIPARTIPLRRKLDSLKYNAPAVKTKTAEALRTIISIETSDPSYDSALK